jgi:hypothetical protein
MLTAAILVAVAVCVPFHTSARETLAGELMEIAQESLNAQYATLVSGDIATGLAGKRFETRFRNAIGDQLTSRVAIRSALLKKKIEFTAFRTKLVFQGLEVKDDKAQLTAIEITERDMNTPPGGPKITKSSDPHIFDFVKTSGEWQLVSDTIVRPKPVFSQDGEDLPLVPLPPPTTDGPPEKNLRRRHHAVLTPRSVAAMPVGYDRITAINYARAHALSYNTDFKRFGNDCTNFISQTLLAGGWQMVYGLYTHNDVWWYTCSLPGGYACHASYTWGAAYNFHAFLNTGPGHRTDYVQYYGDVWPGDLIFADWDRPGQHLPDGRIDHVMFVTGRDTEGNLFISQHTTDRLDRPFAEVILSETSAQFFGHRVKDSY